MHATIRRYDGVDQNRSAELTRKAKDTLVPKLEKLPGFKGYFLIEAGNGTFSSLNLFETPEQGMESTKIVATWIRDEKLETFIPNEPMITSGKVVAHSDRVLVAGVTRPKRMSKEGPDQPGPPIRFARRATRLHLFESGASFSSRRLGPPEDVAHGVGRTRCKYGSAHSRVGLLLTKGSTCRLGCGSSSSSLSC